VLLACATLGHWVSAEELRDFYEGYRSMPAIGIGVLQVGVPTTLVDNEGGIRDLMGHLLGAHGYRRIAFIRGPTTNDEAEQRYHAYTSALAEYGLPFDPDLVAPGDFTPDTGAAAIRLLLDERETNLEAVVAANDNMALGAQNALQTRGLRVPYDVAVVGFDDENAATDCNPPLTTVRQPVYEQARRSVELLLALLEGEKVPEQVLLPTKLVVRQSCGCFFGVGSQIAAKPEVAIDGPAKTALAGQREPILSEMVQAVASSVAEQQRASAWSTQLLDAFFADLNGETSDTFLPTLDTILQQVTAHRGDVTTWYEAVDTLRHRMLPYLTDYGVLSRALDLWQQASRLIGGVRQREQRYERLWSHQWSHTLRIVSQALIDTFDVETLMDVIAQELPSLGIPGCYISLYEHPESPTEWAKLILAYNENGRIDLGKEGRRFPSHQLVPEGLLSGEKNHHLLVESLYSRNVKFGFVVFEVGPLNGNIYTTVHMQISSALKGASLFQEHKQAEEQLAQKAKELARSNAELEQFAYVASHDLQEPLRMVSSYLQLLEKRYKGKLDDNAKEFIEYAVDGASRMKRMIDALLAYSRVITRGQSLDPTDCEQILAQAISNLEVAIREANALISHDPLPTIMADGIQLMMVFQNLISNAAKFQADRRPHIHVSAKQSDGVWVFSVRDNGIGIAPENVERLFVIFSRLHSQAEYPGTGIGLVMCRKVVERHGGNMWVESQPGEGATFFFSIPAYPLRVKTEYPRK
jgi:signal transduction histidine kinase